MNENKMIVVKISSPFTQQLIGEDKFIASPYTQHLILHVCHLFFEAPPYVLTIYSRLT